MAGLVPAIHVFTSKQDVDARHEAGHDVVCDVEEKPRCPEWFQGKPPSSPGPVAASDAALPCCSLRRAHGWWFAISAPACRETAPMRVRRSKPWMPLKKREAKRFLPRYRLPSRKTQKQLSSPRSRPSV